MRSSLFAVFITVCIHVTAQTPTSQRLFDSHMKLKNGSINITTDGLTATTFIEFEFYNDHITEIEGLFKFQLQPEQVITAFQLDLNGKYRDGSIEEKWKATNAYNRIVGKRIDPALLTKEYDNNYSLRIYPVPAKKSRKVTITIQQLLKQNGNELQYILPLQIKDTTSWFSVSVKTYNQQSAPVIKYGLLYGERFSKNEDGYFCIKKMNKYVPDKPIRFELPVIQNLFYCSKKVGDLSHFAIRYKTGVDSVYKIQPKKMLVFWDASSSGEKRETKKEVSFLKQYLSYHKTEEVTLITFNHAIIDTVVFRSKNNSWYDLVEYINELEYDGGTKFSNLSFSSAKPDVIMVFSDGKSSVGSTIPSASKKPLYTVCALSSADSLRLTRIARTSGGAYIPLHKLSISKAVQLTSTAENYLVDIESSGKSIFETSLQAKLNKPLFIHGTTTSLRDTITFVYGNNARITARETIVLDYRNSCSYSAIERIPMLVNYEAVNTAYTWNDLLDFGLKEKIVTRHTAYIVLERIEDYINYNITPPKELEEECRQRGFVKKDTREIRNSLGKISVDSILSGVIKNYNNRIQLWKKDEPLLNYSPAIEKQEILSVQNEQSVTGDGNSVIGQLQGKAAGISISNGSRSLQEVVVVGYGVASKRSLGYAVTSISGNQLFPVYRSVADVLVGRVAGLNVTGNSGEPGSSHNIRIRGASSMSANAQPLFILDGVPIRGNIDDVVNVGNIDNITVLKDASATAIYGSGGANGVIIITSKKGSYQRAGNYNSRYKLKDMPDVDYLSEIKAIRKEDKLSKYIELKRQHKDDAGFYFDMAEHLYEHGFKQQAITVIMNAAELYNNDAILLRTIGFFLESWKEYKVAIEIFQVLLEENPDEIHFYRDLAWAYYQNGDHQKAVDLLYQGIVKENINNNQVELDLIKSIMLNEMNSIIQMHKQQLNLSGINPSLIKPLPCDLRVIVENNVHTNLNLKIEEPWFSTASLYNSKSKHRGFITNNSSRKYYYYQNSIAEYQLKQAVEGKYKVWVDFYNGYQYNGKVPSVIRVCVFKNFGKPNQTIEVKNVMMDNQNGEIEIAELKW